MCMVDEADYTWDVFLQETRRARKTHRCGECGTPINSGDTYCYSKGLGGGEGWQQFRTCAECLPACDWLVAQCGGYLFYGVYEDLHEHWGEGPFALGLTEVEMVGFGRMIIAMKRRIAASQALAAA